LAQRKEDRKAHLTSQYMQRIANMRMQQMGQIFQPGSGGYYLPTLQPQPQRFYGPTQMAQIRPQPRWPAQPQVRANTQAPSKFSITFYTFPSFTKISLSVSCFTDYTNLPTQFRTTPRSVPTTVSQTLRTAVSTRTMNTTPVAARMPPVTPAVLVSQSTATTAVAASARPQPYKYTSNMRNPPQSVSAVQQQQAVQQPAVHVQGQEPLTATMLASADVNEQKQMLGERLFPLIQVSSHYQR